MLQLLFGLSALTSVLACPDHDYSIHERSKFGKRAAVATDWAYEASFNWGKISSNYTLCQTGTMQAPVPLQLADVLSTTHVPTFNYPEAVDGNLYNWGYGPAFTLNTTASKDFTSAPSFTFDDETVYLKGWHIHAPADHSIQGLRPKAELHLVHGDATGKERAVLAIQIDPATDPSAFVAQFEGGTSGSAAASLVPNFDDLTTTPTTMNVLSALQEANMFSEFWTYKGSLTSPPCTEGIRFFVAKDELFTSVGQMQEILRVSTYSARVEQEIWEHEINI